MKRNHGLKVKEKDKVKEKAKEKTGASKDENSSSASADLSGGVLISKNSICDNYLSFWPGYRWFRYSSRQRTNVVARYRYLPSFVFIVFIFVAFTIFILF